jgi:hypothetical protein
VLGVKEFSRGDVEKKRKKKLNWVLRFPKNWLLHNAPIECLAWVTTTYNSNLNEIMYIYTWLLKFKNLKIGGFFFKLNILEKNLKVINGRYYHAIKKDIKCTLKII